MADSDLVEPVELLKLLTWIVYINLDDASSYGLFRDQLEISLSLDEYLILKKHMLALFWILLHVAL